jgi:hypothetical protein
MTTTIHMIDIDKVLNVYSGKPGCMCGCKGKYTFRKATQQLGTENRGYEVTDEECDDAKVQRLINKVTRMLDDSTGDYEVEIDEDGSVYVETPTRIYYVRMIEAFTKPRN